MPFKSKAQQRFMFAAENRGELPKGTAKRWAKHTPNIKKLPEKKKEASFLADLVLRKVAESMEDSEKKEEKEEAEMNPVSLAEVSEFLRNNPAPEDYELHQWAEGKGVSPHSAEELLYQLAAQQVTGKKPEDTTEGGPEEKEGAYMPKWAKEYIEGGKAQGMPASDFPAKQLQMGVKVEKEHTPNPAMAKEIAKDHLEEFSNYYTALDEMEKKLKQQKEASIIADFVLRKAEESEMKKSAQPKLGFAVTPEGHQFDAELAEILQRAAMEEADLRQRYNVLGYRDPETDKNPVDVLKALRYAFSSGGIGDHPTAAARHLAYVARKHREGSNAWNPFGGTLTPLPEEQGAKPGFFGRYGKVKKESEMKKSSSILANAVQSRMAKAAGHKKTASEIADYVLHKIAAPPTPEQIAAMKSGLQNRKMQQAQQTMQGVRGMLQSTPAPTPSPILSGGTAAPKPPVPPGGTAAQRPIAPVPVPKPRPMGQ